jgi:hypothetical protein
MLKKVGHEIDVELLIIRNLKLARLFRKRGSDSDKATSTTWNPLFFPPPSLFLKGGDGGWGDSSTAYR